MLTLIEAAKELRMSERWLRDWLAAHPVDRYGVPFYLAMGRCKRFEPTDELPCPHNWDTAIVNSAKNVKQIKGRHRMDNGSNGTYGANMSGTCVSSDAKLTRTVRGSFLDVPALRRIIKSYQMTAPADLSPHFSNLDQMLKSWDAGGNRDRLRPAIELAIQTIESLTKQAA